MVNRIVVGAHYGLRDWIAQRVTAVVMALYTVVFALRALSMAEMNFENWHAMFASGYMRIATFLFFACLFYHAWVGIRDLWMDYVKPVGVRLFLHVVTILLLVGYLFWTAQILWRL